MAGYSPLASDEMATIMLDGLMDRIRMSLRERIMERIQPDIDAAVEAGCETFRAAVASYLDPMGMRQVVKVLIEDRRTKA